jgi:hypothetical protein
MHYVVMLAGGIEGRLVRPRRGDRASTELYDIGEEA